MIQEPADFRLADRLGNGDIATAALVGISTGGLTQIVPTLAELEHLGFDISSEQMQPVLIEIVVHMLEALENDLANPAVYSLVFKLDKRTARAAKDLLFIANFPEGAKSFFDAGFYELGDGTALLLAALTAAAGQTDEAGQLLLRIEYNSAGLQLEQALLQLRCKMLSTLDEIVEHLIFQVLDCLDHPELWNSMPFLLEQFPELPTELERRNREATMHEANIAALHAVCVAAAGRPEEALKLIEPIAVSKSLLTIVQGAVFRIKSLLDPSNPIYDLTDRICATPFDQMDILDGSSHVCCASWIMPSVGNLAETPWRDVWNSERAQKIRASILDGSYRYCNKTACPQFSANTLPTKAQLTAQSARWRDILATNRTELEEGPSLVNLAYDSSCNLSCPSCRVKMFAADSATRARFEKLQNDAILPILAEARTVFISGYGDPFASKNFRGLIERLGPEDYPHLRFQLMTNGMLLTPREWARFPSLHGRVASLRISLDAATGPTHELLRRGARWSVVEENLAFVRDLRAQGLVSSLCFAFTVQVDNYREMGEAVDLGLRFGADQVSFMRLTNWGTFTTEQYAEKAVFMPSHPEYADFVRLMQDPRLKDPIAALYDLSGFVDAGGQ